jgi:hypothetical protein
MNNAVPELEAGLEARCPTDLLKHILQDKQRASTTTYAIVINKTPEAMLSRTSKSSKRARDGLYD